LVKIRAVKVYTTAEAATLTEANSFRFGLADKKDSVRKPGKSRAVASQRWSDLTRGAGPL
jgi:hypothetical protein